MASLCLIVVVVVEVVVVVAVVLVVVIVVIIIVVVVVIIVVVVVVVVDDVIDSNSNMVPIASFRLIFCKQNIDFIMKTKNHIKEAKVLFYKARNRVFSPVLLEK